MSTQTTQWGISATILVFAVLMMVREASGPAASAAEQSPHEMAREAVARLKYMSDDSFKLDHVFAKRLSPEAVCIEYHEDFDGEIVQSSVVFVPPLIADRNSPAGKMWWNTACAGNDLEDIPY